MSRTRRTAVRASLLGLAAAVALLGAGAGAAQGSVSTGVAIDDSTASGAPLTVWGHLASPEPRCLAGRTVKLFQDFADHTTKLVGRDRSSRNGVWVAQGDISKRAVGLHVRVTSKTLGHGHRRRTCARTSKAFSI
jgi:hypothetical protein